MKSFFTPREVAQIVGISYRQIQYWDKTNFVRPSYRRKGKYRLYTFLDLVQLKLARTLRSSKVSIQRLRATMASLKTMLANVNKPLVELTFLVDGGQILIFDGNIFLNGSSEKKYVRFDVRTLRNDVNDIFGVYSSGEYVQKIAV